jgi:beta-1,2-mannobiose phosphorylase / 1,2-beta-oligomannan phosphorylase
MRFSNNPLIKPVDIKATRDDFEVKCVLNPAVTCFGEETILLMRVCERPKQEKGWVTTAVLDLEVGGYKPLRFKLNDPLFDNSDSRVFRYGDKSYLSTISHLRIARSKDGQNFTVDEKPFIYPAGQEEEFGTEDARITFIDGVYYIYYVAVSRNSYCTKMAVTTDWKTYESKSIIFHPQNKDVAIFEGRVKGDYAAFHRPEISAFGARPGMWLAYSSDLYRWGQHKLLILPRPGKWDSGRIGAGTVPILTEKGWFEIYHGADDNSTYSLGFLLLDRNNPGKVLFRSEKPFFTPQTDFEKEGFFGNVVFTNGMAYYPETDDLVHLYYGAADTYICGAGFNLRDMLEMCS